MIATYAVDDYGRDPHLVAALSPLARLRWNVSVTGAGNIPGSAALLVCNSRRFSLGALYAALALTDTTGRTVRFVGRPDTAPVGALMRRVGALLAHPADVLSALRAGELVLVSAAGTTHARHAGAVPHELIGQAKPDRSCGRQPYGARLGRSAFQVALALEDLQVVMDG